MSDAISNPQEENIKTQQAMQNQPSIKEMFSTVFGMPKELPKPEEDLNAPIAPKKPKVEETKELPDINLAIRAQKIYNPNMPGPIPKQNTKIIGTAGNMDTNGAWGTPERLNRK